MCERKDVNTAFLCLPQMDTVCDDSTIGIQCVLNIIYKKKLVTFICTIYRQIFFFINFYKIRTNLALHPLSEELLLLVNFVKPKVLAF